MADHNAHTYFGQEVMKRLPRDLRSHCTADLPAFHLGLYGPDPLIFSFQTKKTSDKLHKQWRNVSLPALSKALRHGDATQRSFAAGYLLHLLLDDTVHPPIYRWMEEGASHFRMEVALDLILLEEQRRANSPKVHTEGKERPDGGRLHPSREGAAVSLRPVADGHAVQPLLRTGTGGLRCPAPAGQDPGPRAAGPHGSADPPGRAGAGGAVDAGGGAET